MKIIDNLGYMQGRLTPTKNGIIQSFPEKNWDKEFKLANSLGLRYMEWTLDYKNLFKNPIFKNKEIKKIKYLSKKFNIKIKTLTGDCFMQKPFWKEKNSKKLITDFKKIVKACSKLRINNIIFPLVDNSSIRDESDEKIIIESFQKLKKFLIKNKVTILFESDFRPENLKKFINKFDKKCFGINYDTGNSAGLGYKVEKEFEYYGKFIKNIHIKDKILRGKTVRLGKGCAKFDKVFKSISKIKYKKLLILQTARTLIKNNDLSELKTNINFVKRAIK
jgi:L-ribulose-5-phosphate 3-epimerase